MDEKYETNLEIVTKHVMSNTESQLQKLDPPLPPGYRRNCDACDRCQVKCDLGPVNTLPQPPCARCRRENKQCVFSVDRRKPRPETPDIDTATGLEPQGSSTITDWVKFTPALSGTGIQPLYIPPGNKDQGSALVADNCADLA